jgi:hypothetical protein
MSSKVAFLKKVECITATDIKVDLDVLGNLGRLHKEQLNKEFGFNFRHANNHSLSKERWL